MELNPVETAMWRAETADPRLRSNVTLLEILDRAPEWERFLAAHEWASRMVPRIRQRIVEPALGVGAPTWVTVEELDLVKHVRHVRLPAPGSRRQLLDAVRDLAQEPLERDRPLWRAALVEGLEGGGAGYVVVTHHSVTDGLGAVQLMSLLHSRTAEHDPQRPEPPEPLPTPPPSSAALQVGQAAKAVPGLLGSLTRPLAHPLTTATDGVAAARALGSSFGPAPVGSPLLAHRGGGWHFETVDVPLAALKAGAKAAGGSVNDGFLAAVLGALRHYHQQLGAGDVATVPIGIPISLRREDDQQGGNKFTGARFEGSLLEPDPAERIRAVRRFVLDARAGTGNDAAAVLTPALAWLPAPVLGVLSGRLTSANDVQASNVPGITHPAFIAGARIERMYPFGPLPGCGAMITMLSHDGTCCIGLNLDPAAVTEPEVLVVGLEEALAEVVALA